MKRSAYILCLLALAGCGSGDEGDPTFPCTGEGAVAAATGFLPEYSWRLMSTDALQGEYPSRMQEYTVRGSLPPDEVQRTVQGLEEEDGSCTYQIPF